MVRWWVVSPAIRTTSPPHNLTTAQPHHRTTSPPHNLAITDKNGQEQEKEGTS